MTDQPLNTEYIQLTDDINDLEESLYEFHMRLRDMTKRHLYRGAGAENGRDADRADRHRTGGAVPVRCRDAQSLEIIDGRSFYDRLLFMRRYCRRCAFVHRVIARLCTRIVDKWT